jgi:hypothetical protein
MNAILAFAAAGYIDMNGTPYVAASGIRNCNGNRLPPVTVEIYWTAGPSREGFLLLPTIRM